MTQLSLVEIPTVPTLTPRQARALEIVQQHPAGIHADELGAILHEEHHRHSRDQRCQFDGANGNSILKALRKKGLVRYRRGRDFTAGHWEATTPAAQPEPEPAGEWDGTLPVPYGVIPF